MNKPEEKDGNLATRDSFFSAVATRYHVTDDIPPFGKVRLQSISEYDQKMIEAKRFDPKTGKLSDEKYAEVFAWMCIYMVVDEHGDQIFGAMDLKKLRAIDRAYSKPLMEEMNKHAEAVPASATDEDHEDLKKNCETAPNCSNGSESQTELVDSTSSG